MLVCPVCEHAQADGLECENCGRLFQAPLSPPEEFAPLPDLEPTLRPDSGEEAAVEEVPGIEPTASAPVELPATETLADLERNTGAPVDPPIETLADLERLGDLGPPERTPLPAVVVCRYCRTEASPGERICGLCGMRLPVFASEVERAGGEEPVRICSCGAPLRSSRCPSCGARA